MRSIGYFVLLMIFSFSPALAGDPRPHEAAVTKLAAKAVYAQSRCPNMRANLGVLAVVGQVYGVKIEDWQAGGRLRALFDADVDVLKAETGQSDDRIFCKAVEVTLGPNGRSYPGLMEMK
jgi:hypothetical protein